MHSDPNLNSGMDMALQRRSIIIVGYMCAGKTTVGKSLAKSLGRTFYDLDWYIEERFRKRVQAIFDEDGEERFRDIERRMLHEVAEFENIVLSCGGGTPCFFDNMDYMNQCAHTVYLKASVPTLLAHIAMSRGERPLLKGKSPEQLEDFITQQLRQREPFYMKANHVVEIDVLNTFDKIEEIANIIRTQLTL